VLRNVPECVNVLCCSSFLWWWAVLNLGNFRIFCDLIPTFFLQSFKKTDSLLQLETISHSVVYLMVSSYKRMEKETERETSYLVRLATTPDWLVLWSLTVQSRRSRAWAIGRPNETPGRSWVFSSSRSLSSLNSNWFFAMDRISSLSLQRRVRGGRDVNIAKSDESWATLSPFAIRTTVADCYCKGLDIFKLKKKSELLDCWRERERECVFMMLQYPCRPLLKPEILITKSRIKPK